MGAKDVQRADGLTTAVAGVPGRATGYPSRQYGTKGLITQIFDESDAGHDALTNIYYYD